MKLFRTFLVSGFLLITANNYSMDYLNYSLKCADATAARLCQWNTGKMIAGGIVTGISGYMFFQGERYINNYNKIKRAYIKNDTLADFHKKYPTTNPQFPAPETLTIPRILWGTMTLINGVIFATPLADAAFQLGKEWVKSRFKV